MENCISWKYLKSVIDRIMMIEADENSMDISSDNNNEKEVGYGKLNTRNFYSFKPFVFTEINKPPGLKQPLPRSGHRTDCNESDLYSLGGYLEIADVGNKVSRLRRRAPLIEKKVFEELYKFNFCSQEWKKIDTTGNFPEGLISHTMALHGNHLIVFGGTSIPFGKVTSNSVDICNLQTNSWTHLNAHGEIPGGIYGHSMILDQVHKCLYTIGGTTGYQYFIDIYKLDLLTGKWEALFISQGDILQTGEPSPRYRHETAFDGTLIYIFGGGKPTCSDSFTSIPVFNVHTRVWSSKETKSDDSFDLHLHPSPRKCHGLIQTGDNVWISGGENENELYDEFWNLHLPTMKWNLIPLRIPMQLSFHSSSITPQGCMYIFGGVNKIHQQDRNGNVFKDRTNTIFKTWLQIPSLKEICWEALVHYEYKSSMNNSSPSDLIARGIPREFAARVDNIL